jgi:hypothetical protein
MSRSQAENGQPAVGTVVYTRGPSGSLRGEWTCNAHGYEQATALETAVPDEPTESWAGRYAVDIYDPAGKPIYSGSLEIKAPPPGGPVYHMAWTSLGDATYLGLGLSVGTQLAVSYWLAAPGAAITGPFGAVEAGVA